MARIVVSDYDPAWPATFEALRAPIWGVLEDFAITIEHVGSTSVPGLAAKPIIDMDVIVRSASDVTLAITRLATLGYLHQGDLGIPDREAFAQPARLPVHHLYLCPQSSAALANHLAVRDYLRAHPESAKAYGQLKRRLAEEFAMDMAGYVEAKSEFIRSILDNPRR